MRVGCAIVRVGAVFLAVVGIIDCGGKGTARPDDEVGGVAGNGGAGTTGGAQHVAGAGGTAMVTACATPNADDYAANWMPPKATPGACTTQQIADAYALCQSEKYDAKACRAFNVDVANSRCLDCLYSDAKSTNASGALLLLQRGYPIANVGGCIALLDGDDSETSCGARTQAAGVCEYTACLTACPNPPVPDAEWSACLASARSGACASYINDSTCVALPRYARCQYPNFAEFFNGMGDLFCGSGPPAGTGQGGGGQGGASDVGAAGAAP